MNEDERIRQRAHQIWVEEGKPEGRERDHWQMARQLVAIEDAPGDDLKPNPLSHPEAEPVEEAALQENLGEFPTLTDQGEEATAPSARRKAASSTDTKSKEKEKDKKQDKKRSSKSAS